MTTKTIPETEQSFMGAVMDLARLRGWMCHHCRPARMDKGYRTPIQGHAGFPDLVLARRGEVIFAELKSEKGRLTVDQQWWLDTLSSGDHQVHVWRPSDFPTIERTLR